MDEQTRIERINLGHASAYAYYKAGGGTGTEEEFTQWMADLGIQVEYLENMAVVTNTLEPGTPASATYEDGVLTLNIPKGEKGDPAPQEEVTAATDAWLQENITNPSNPPLDRSLALANAAAPADMVGDLKSAIDAKNTEIYNGYEPTTLTFANGWINSSGVYNPEDTRFLSNVIETDDLIEVVNGSSSTIYAVYFSAYTSLSDFTYATYIAINANNTLPISKMYPYVAIESTATDISMLEGILLKKKSIINYLSYNSYNRLNNSLDDITTTEKIITTVLEKSVGEESYPEGVTLTQGYLRNMTMSAPGNLSGTDSDINRTFSYVATEEMDIFVEYTQGASQQLGIFDGAAYGAAYRVSPIYASNTDAYPLPTSENPVHVEAGQYITFSAYHTSATTSNVAWKICKVANGNSSLKSTLPLTQQMSDEVDAKIGNFTNEVIDTGYYHIGGQWVRGNWEYEQGQLRINSRQFRVSLSTPITFDRKSLILTDVGYVVAGYADGVFFDGVSTKEVYPNIEYNIYIRKYPEDTSIVADIDTFANAVHVSTPLAPIESYWPTFTDISMFERIGIGGDSYANGGGIISGKTNLAWGKNLERQTSIPVDVYAKSGKNVVEWTATTDSWGLSALLNGTECGLYWLHHGINGTENPNDLGTAADMSANPHPSTFYGQYVEAIERIQATFPNARIVVATVCGSSWFMAQTTHYINANTAIKAIAEYCKIPCIDITQDDFFRSPFYIRYIRSNHPTAMTFAGMAMAYRRLLSKCIQENPMYFVGYGSDGNYKRGYNDALSGLPYDDSEADLWKSGWNDATAWLAKFEGA